MNIQAQDTMSLIQMQKQSYRQLDREKSSSKDTASLSKVVPLLNLNHNVLNAIQDEHELGGDNTYIDNYDNEKSPNTLYMSTHKNLMTSYANCGKWQGDANIAQLSKDKQVSS